MTAARRLVVIAASICLSSCDGASSASSGKRVTRTEFNAAGLSWPLTVETGSVGCDGNARWFEAGGVRYGLNGFASVERGYHDLEPIWAEDLVIKTKLAEAGITGAPTMRVNIHDLSEQAAKLCS